MGRASKNVQGGLKHKKMETKTLNILNRRKIQDVLLKYMKNILILYQETVHFTEVRWKKPLLIFSLEKPNHFVVKSFIKKSCARTHFS
jgi:hypothetical protein